MYDSVSVLTGGESFVGAQSLGQSVNVRSCLLRSPDRDFSVDFVSNDLFRTVQTYPPEVDTDPRRSSDCHNSGSHSSFFLLVPHVPTVVYVLVTYSGV